MVAFQDEYEHLTSDAQIAAERFFTHREVEDWGVMDKWATAFFNRSLQAQGFVKGFEVVPGDLEYTASLKRIAPQLIVHYDTFKNPKSKPPEWSYVPASATTVSVPHIGGEDKDCDTWITPDPRNTFGFRCPPSRIQSLVYVGTVDDFPLDMPDESPGTFFDLLRFLVQDVVINMTHHTEKADKELGQPLNWQYNLPRKRGIELIIKFDPEKLKLEKPAYMEVRAWTELYLYGWRTT